MSYAGAFTRARLRPRVLVDVSGVDTGTSVLGLGYQFNLRAIYDLPQFGSMAHRLSFGLDYNQASLSTFVFDEESGELEAIEAPVDVTYYPLIVDYTLNRVTDSNSTGLSLSLAANLRGAADGDEVAAAFHFASGKARDVGVEQSTKVRRKIEHGNLASRARARDSYGSRMQITVISKPASAARRSCRARSARRATRAD